MTISVMMFIEAVEKYIAGRFLHPSGKVGAHAQDGSVLHLKA
jgi:hypothetical protein